MRLGLPGREIPGSPVFKPFGVLPAFSIVFCYVVISGDRVIAA